MAALSIRDLDDGVRAAAQHGRSMESESGAILTEAVSGPEQVGLAQTLFTRFRVVRGVEVDLPPRRQAPRAADLRP